MNSSIAAAKLSGYLEEFKPRIVLCCIGRNDNWNFEKVNFDVLQTEIGRDLFWYRLDSLLVKFRVYKLIRYINRMHGYGARKLDEPLSTVPKEGINVLYAQESKIEIITNNTQNFIKKNEFSNAIGYLNSVKKGVINSGDDLLMSGLGWLYIDCYDMAQALELFNESLRNNNSQVNAYHGKGELCFLQGEYKLSVKYLKKAAQMAPRDYPLNNLLYRHLGTAYFYSGNKRVMQFSGNG